MVSGFVRPVELKLCRKSTKTENRRTTKETALVKGEKKQRRLGSGRELSGIPEGAGKRASGGTL